MNKCKMLLIWLVLFNCQGYSQEFFEIRNRSEFAIVDGDMNKALKLYQSTPMDELDLDDLNNFFLVASKANNVILGLEICKEISQRGVGRSYFGKSIFKSLSNTKEFKDILKNADASRNKLVTETNRYSEIIDSVYKVDQVLAKNRTQRYSGKEIPTAILDSFDTNAKYLMKFVKQKGFPTEGNIAPEIYQDSIYHFNMDYLLIFVHCFQMSPDDALKDECKKLIIDAINNGIIPKSHLFFMQRFGHLVISESLGEEHFAYDPLSKKLWKSNHLTADNLLKVNKTRALYNFSTMEDEIRKFDFVTQNNKFKFEINIKTVVLEYMEERERAKFLESYHELSK